MTDSASEARRSRGAAAALLRADSPALLWIGIVLTGLGFVTIAYTWGKVAGLTAVALQLPYFASGGLSALALVLVGLTIVNVAAKRRDAAERDRQVEQLAATMAELRAALETRDEAGSSRRRRA